MSLFELQTPFQWRCPTCMRDVIVSKDCVHRRAETLETTLSPEDGAAQFKLLLIVCPNPACRAPYVATKTQWGRMEFSPGQGHVFRPRQPIGIGEFTFAPVTAAPLSIHVPQPVRDDYNEASLIRTLSPKASATLARRALQGMIRDRWGVVKPRLHDELLAIKDECDPELHGAMMALKAIGNIGAHPEMDAAIIVDIEEGEAEELLNLLQLLDSEWYIARAKRMSTIAAVKALGAEKQLAKRPAAPA